VGGLTNEFLAKSSKETGGRSEAPSRAEMTIRKDPARFRKIGQSQSRVEKRNGQNERSTVSRERRREESIGERKNKENKESHRTPGVETNGGEKRCSSKREKPLGEDNPQDRHPKGECAEKSPTKLAPSPLQGRAQVGKTKDRGEREGRGTSSRKTKRKRKKKKREGRGPLQGN